MGGRTVTFLFTDIEGSTRLWDESPETMAPALARHDALLRGAIAEAGGETFKTVGDAFCAAFEAPAAGVAAALAAQRALANEPWATSRPIRVRMALHTGSCETRDGDYFGRPLNRVARLLSIGHGGQTLLSSAAYELARDSLPDGAFLAPLGDHRLKDLARPETVHGLLHAELPSAFPPLRSLGNESMPNNLPEQPTSFVGREKELAEVVGALGRTRLLTLSGPGGSGKTRLALQAAAEAVDGFPGGAWFVELASLEDSNLVAQTVATVLGVVEEAGRSTVQAIADRLRKEPTLLVLDNCEHLLDSAARLVDALVRAAPGLCVLATSREPLGIAGETVRRVPTLSLPGRDEKATVESLSHYEAVRLFVERAVAQRGDFQVTNANAPALASLCLHLDGIPLAIELAAARVRSLSVEGIDARLDDRFRLLTGGSRTALPRQQTLRALIEWSHDLLGEAERAAFHRAAAFQGGWTLEAAETVIAGEDIADWEVLDLLASLVDKSLVTADEAGGTVRYGMLESIRHFAQDRLRESGEATEAHARHAAFFTAAALADGHRCRESGETVRRLALETDNLRAALDRAGPADRLAMVGALHYLWIAKGTFREGLDRCREALADSAGLPRFDALMGRLGWLSIDVGESAESAVYSDEAVALASGDADKEIDALNLRACAAWLEGDLARTRALFERALEVRESAKLWSNLAGLLLDAGDYAAGEAAIERDALVRAAANDYDMCHYLHRRFALAYRLGRAEEAEREIRACAALARKLESATLILTSKVALASVLRALNRPEEALATAREAVAEATNSESKEWALLTLARATTDREEARGALLDYFRSHTPYFLPAALDAAAFWIAPLREAAVLLGAASAARVGRQMPLPPVDVPEREGLVARLRAALGEGYPLHVAEGEAMGLGEATAVAVAALAR